MAANDNFAAFDPSPATVERLVGRAFEMGLSDAMSKRFRAGALACNAFGVL